MEFHQKKHKKTDFYKKSKYYQEARRKYLKIGAACGAGILLLLLAVAAFSRPSGGVPASGRETASQDTQNPASSGREEAAGAGENADTLPEEPVSLVVTTVGDCTLGMDESFDYSTSLNAAYDANGKDYFFQNVRSLFQEDDLTIANAEGTFTHADTRADKQFAFKSDPEYAQIFTSGSVEAVTLANNHSHDYGDQSFEDTKDALDAAGVVPSVTRKPQ